MNMGLFLINEPIAKSKKIAIQKKQPSSEFRLISDLCKITANGKRLCEGAEIEAQKFSLALPKHKPFSIC